MTKEERQSEKHYSWLSRIAVLLGVLGFLFFFLPFSLIIYRPRLAYFPSYRFACIPASIGLIISIFVIAKTNKTRNRAGLRTAKVGVILTAIITIASVFVPPRISFATRMVCGTHMSCLGKAMISYAQENNENYPNPQKWCDLLLETEQVGPKDFLCLPDYKVQYLGFSYAYPQPAQGKCHYAMNINCKPDSSPDTVLLFETTLGWNKHGGAELLTLDNHDGDGCNIVFNDGHVTFERRPRELNWGVTSNNSIQSDPRTSGR